MDIRTDRVGVPGAPLFHIAGLAGGLPPLLLGGTHVIIRSGGFDPVATLDLIERERVTSIFLVPAMWAAVVAVPDIADARPVLPAADLLGRRAGLDDAAAHDDRHVPAGRGR